MTLSPHLQAAVERVEADHDEPLAIAEALVDLAVDLQRQPRHPQEILDAVTLYDRAADYTSDDPLARARALAGKGSALRRLPGGGLESLGAAKEAIEEALPVLQAQGEAEETAEVEMTYGLVLHAMAGAGEGSLGHAVQAYQRALRTFKRETHPREFAILHNNLATAYLAMKMSPEREKIREALAVQSFQQALEVVTLREDPVEYAMLQNNLGNALQAVQSSHRFDNLARAVEAYDEALKVRTREDMPVEHANTLTNKANALMNLPDDPEDASKGNPEHLGRAIGLLRTAQEVFRENGVHDRAEIVGQLATDLEADV